MRQRFTWLLSLFCSLSFPRSPVPRVPPARSCPTLSLHLPSQGMVNEPLPNPKKRQRKRPESRKQDSTDASDLICCAAGPDVEQIRVQATKLGPPHPNCDRAVRYNESVMHTRTQTDWKGFFYVSPLTFTARVSDNDLHHPRQEGVKLISLPCVSTL